MASINFRAPNSIADEIHVSKIYENIGATGNPTSYGVDARFDALEKKQSFKSRDLQTLASKLETALDKWAKQYEKYLNDKHKESRADHAERKNHDLAQLFSDLDNLLNHTLDIDDRVNWEALKTHAPFRLDPDKLLRKCDSGNKFKTTRSPKDWIQFSNTGEPIGFDTLSYPTQPDYEVIKSSTHILKRLLKPSYVPEAFEAATERWRTKTQKIDNQNNDRKAFFDKARRTYHELSEQFEAQKQKRNETIDNLWNRFNNGDSKAVEEHIDIVFQASDYPSCIPRAWDREYRPDSRMMIIDLELPTPNNMPKVEKFTYVKSRDEITEKSLPETKRRSLYDDVIYKIILRTVHEIFESDVPNLIDYVAINGYVDSINSATGQRERKVIASLSVDKYKFNAIALSNIKPKDTFKHFKGVSAARLSDVAAVPPVIQMDKSDKRFIEGENVAENISEGTNLAAIDWQDFEYLIREIFDAEFQKNGGEVKVTQASSDGGVDAIAFDNDPIRGGKIVIQAKRYTNTVGVGSVRDLYGTVMNEGASSGVLVTTSDFGKDAYDFAKDKPLKLLNGSNLLSLLERHGHTARIDLAEAKSIRDT